MWKIEQHTTATKYDIFHSFVPLVKNYHVNYEEDDKPIEIACKHCNGFVRFSGRSGELLYINFIHADMYTIGLYPGELVPENFYFLWPSRTKMQRIYKRLLKEGNGYHKYLRCSDLQDKNFEILRSAILLDKVDLVCA